MDPLVISCGIVQTHQLREQRPPLGCHGGFSTACYAVHWTDDDHQNCRNDGQNDVIKHHGEIKFLAVLRPKAAVVSEHIGRCGR